MTSVSFQHGQKILYFFAHPDDEVLAAGATLKRLSALGSEVHVAIPATGIHSRRNIQSSVERARDLAILRENIFSALEFLGVSEENIYLGEFADNEMDSGSRLDLIHWLEAHIERVMPEVIFTHHRFCTNIDHQYCHEAAVVATRPTQSRRLALLTAEVPSSTGYLRPAQWEPNLYIAVTEEQVEAKIEAMQRYTTEVRQDPHPRSPDVLRALAKVRGSEAGCHFAEAFMIQRIIVDENV